MQHITPIVNEESFLQNHRDEHTSHSDLNKSIATLLSALTSNFSNQRINNSKHLILVFLNEITRRSKSSQDVVISATYLFDRIYNVNLKNISMSKMPEFSRCSKRIFLCCLIIAHKFQNDSTFSMKTWSLISGLKAKDLASMERWTLSILNYNVWVESSILKTWSRSVLFDRCDLSAVTLQKSSSFKRHIIVEPEDDSLLVVKKLRKVA